MIKSTDLRIGNLLTAVDEFEREHLVKVNMLDELGNIEASSGFLKFNGKLEPIPLTEENILKLRYVQREDFAPLCFAKHPPGERQIENNFWSTWIHEDYRLHLSPSYDYEIVKGERIKSTPAPKFWFCWYSATQWFLPIVPIRGEHQLRYIHQLQNLWHTLTGQELIIK